MNETDDGLKKQGKRVVRQLKKDYSHAVCALRYETPVQLLVATILSAQCTDERVNKVTANLFRRYPDAERLGKAPIRSLEKLVQSAGFFRNKAKNIKACCQQLVAEHGGQVPKDLDALVALAGVGRKTAERLLVELKNRLEELVVVPEPTAAATGDSQALLEAEQALQALGYKPQEAQRAVSAVADGYATAEEIVTAALKRAVHAEAAS